MLISFLHIGTKISDFQLASLGSFFLHESVFFLSGLPFIYLKRARLVRKYKIQVNSIFFAAIIINCYYFVDIKILRGEGREGVLVIKMVYFLLFFLSSGIHNKLVHFCNLCFYSDKKQQPCYSRKMYHFGINLPVMIASYPVFRFMGMRSSLPLPS